MMKSGEKKFVFRHAFEWFVHSQVSGSILLLLCTISALIWANSQYHGFYEHLLHTEISLSFGNSVFGLSLHHWINDGLMVLFFFVVGLEIKRELVVGRLSSFRRALLPVTAAVGGMFIPALLYAVLNRGGSGADGWGIPMATDIAFALGVLAIFGSRVPIGLKVFLTALAIADDLGAVVVIAVFYTDTIHLVPLIIAGVLLLVLFLTVRIGVEGTMPLLGLSCAIWVAVLASGVHATVAGILVALIIPVRPRVGLGDMLESTHERIRRIAGRGVEKDSILHDQEQLDTVREIVGTAGRALPPGMILEHLLHPVQVWLVLPLFALANAGVRFDTNIFETISGPISLGIIFGLVIGKVVGIVIPAWLVIRSGLGSLPEGVGWGQIAGAAFLAGIGFTMSMFVAALAFGDPGLLAEAKTGILVASLCSGIIGFVVLKWTLPQRKDLN